MRLHSASATAAAPTLLRQHCSRNYNCSCYNHAITTIASTVATQVETQVQTSATHVMVNASAMPVLHETMACAADDANASTNMNTNADAKSMQRNSRCQCKRRCSINTSVRAGAYAQACKRQTSTKYTPRHVAASKLQSKPTAPTFGYMQLSNASNPTQSKQCTRPVCMHPNSIHVPNQYTCI